MALPRSQSRGGTPPRPASWRERLGALRNLPPFLAMVWRTSRLLTGTTVAVRLVRALLSIATLFIGKLIIDEVVHLNHLAVRPVGLAGWLGSGLLDWLEGLLLAEFALAVAADLLGRLVSLVDGLLSDRVSNDASVRLMEHPRRSTSQISKTPPFKTAWTGHGCRQAGACR